MTYAARKVITSVKYVVGYKTYIKLIKPLLSEDQILMATGMRGEVERCKEAVKLAEEGREVAVISSGDAGIYGMAGLVYQLVEKSNKKIRVTVLPGITASVAAAALLGAPLMHDHCNISLSDLLTPWEMIKKRIEAAAQADFVIAFYNPRSRERTTQIIEAREILLKYRSPETPVGIVRNAYRQDQQIIISNLRDFIKNEIDMLSLVIVGNNQTYTIDDKVITPRGYMV